MASGPGRQCRSAGGVFQRSPGGVRGCASDDCLGVPCVHCTDLESWTPIAWQINRLTNITWDDDCHWCPGDNATDGGTGWYGESYFKNAWENTRPWQNPPQPCSNGSQGSHTGPPAWTALDPDQESFVTRELTQHAGWGPGSEGETQLCPSPCVYLVEEAFAGSYSYFFLGEYGPGEAVGGFFEPGVTCDGDPLDTSGLAGSVGLSRVILEFNANLARLFIIGATKNHCSPEYAYPWLSFYDEQSIENCVDEITFNNQFAAGNLGATFDLSTIYPCVGTWPYGANFPEYAVPHNDIGIVYGHGGSFKVTRCPIEGI